MMPADAAEIIRLLHRIDVGQSVEVFALIMIAMGVMFRGR